MCILLSHICTDRHNSIVIVAERLHIFPFCPDMECPVLKGDAAPERIEQSCNQFHPDTICYPRLGRGSHRICLNAGYPELVRAEHGQPAVVHRPGEEGTTSVYPDKDEEIVLEAMGLIDRLTYLHFFSPLTPQDQTALAERDQQVVEMTPREACRRQLPRTAQEYKSRTYFSATGFKPIYNVSRRQGFHHEQLHSTIELHKYSTNWPRANITNLECPRLEDIIAELPEDPNAAEDLLQMELEDSDDHHGTETDFSGSETLTMR